MKRFLWMILLAVLVILAGIIYWRYYWEVGDGVQGGELNFVVRKGYVFKTYEGKLIQSGFRARTQGSVQSNEFNFSIDDKAIAEKLMLNGGKEVQVHYKEYNHALPWRGYHNYVVDSVISIRELSR